MFLYQSQSRTILAGSTCHTGQNQVCLALFMLQTDANAKVASRISCEVSRMTAPKVATLSDVSLIYGSVKALDQIKPGIYRLAAWSG